MLTVRLLVHLRETQRIFLIIWLKLAVGDKVHLWSATPGHWQCTICCRLRKLWVKRFQLKVTIWTPIRNHHWFVRKIAPISLQWILKKRKITILKKTLLLRQNYIIRRETKTLLANYSWWKRIFSIFSSRNVTIRLKGFCLTKVKF